MTLPESVKAIRDEEKLQKYRELFIITEFILKKHHFLERKQIDKDGNVSWASPIGTMWNAWDKSVARLLGEEEMRAIEAMRKEGLK